MAHITINQYLQQVRCWVICFSTSPLSLVQSVQWIFFVVFFLLQVSEAIDNHDGSFCAELLSFKHPHVANPRLQVKLCPPRYDEKSIMLLGYGLICMCLSAGQSRRKMSTASRATIRWDGCSSPQVVEPNSQSVDTQTAEKPIRAQPVLRHGATLLCVFKSNLHPLWL